MELISIPTPMLPTPQATLDRLKQLNCIAPAVTPFGSEADYAIRNNLMHWYSIRGLKVPKFWCDTVSQMRPWDTTPVPFVTHDGTAIDLTAPAAFSDPMFRLVSTTVGKFYQERIAAKDKVFYKIPRLVVSWWIPAEAGDMQFALGGPSAPYPLGRLEPDPLGPIRLNGQQMEGSSGPAEGNLKCSYPANMAMRFDPSTGLPQTFDYQAYSAAYPIDWSVSVPGGQPSGGGSVVPTLSIDAMVTAISAALFSNPDNPTRESSVRKLYKVG